MSKDDVKNKDYVGDAAKQEKTQQGPYKTEKVWDWTCGAPIDKCGRAASKRTVTLPVGKKPDPCRGCNGEDWNKVPGERTRGVKSSAAPEPTSVLISLDLISLERAIQNLKQYYGI